MLGLDDALRCEFGEISRRARKSPCPKLASFIEAHLTNCSETLQEKSGGESVDSGPMRVLVVEDEPKVAGALSEGLAAERYDVVLERTGEGGFYRIITEAFDIVLLDLGLPGRSGLDILTTIRRKKINTSVIVLTARDSIRDRVAGLDAGADDYLVKPFAFAELLARMRALVRRGRTVEVAPT